jgi:hypothetical protein
VNEVRGTIVVSVVNGELHATIGDRSTKSTSVRGDTFCTRWFRNDGPEKVVFPDATLTWDGRTFRRR